MHLNVLYLALFFGAIILPFNPIVAVVFTIIFSFEWWILYMPIWMQYPYYKFVWKRQKLKVFADTPLLAYPMAIFFAISLDESFRKGGIRGALQAILDQMQKIQTNIIEVLSN